MAEAATDKYDPSAFGQRCTSEEARVSGVVNGIVYICPLTEEYGEAGPEFAYSCSAEFLLEHWPEECFLIDRAYADAEMNYVAGDGYALEPLVLGCYPAMRVSEVIALLENWVATSEYQEWLGGRPVE